jgi:superfamily II DNA or RNA helicase
MDSPQPGQWWFSRTLRQAGQVLAVEELWGQASATLWFPRQQRPRRLLREDLLPTAEAGPPEPSTLVWQLAAARIREVLSQEKMLAPLEGTVLPLPHQIHALAKALGGDRVRYLLADEVGLGKTVEAGLILRELKLRGLVRRTAVVAPKGLLTQWVQEMRLHFGEEFHLVLGPHLKSGQGEEANHPFLRHDQVVCSLDSVKPLEKRRGWSAARIAAWNRDRFESLLLAGWDLVILDEAHRLAGSTDEVARHRLGLGLAQAAPFVLLLSATPHQGKSEGFHRLLTILDAEAFPDAASVTRERVEPYVIRTEKRRAIDSQGRPLFLPRSTRLTPVAWTGGHQAQRQLYEAVTEYVRWGYNRAREERQAALGFLMVLMQRLVTSSTRSIRRALERRREVLEAPESEVPGLEPGEEDFADGDETEVVLERLLQAQQSAREREILEVDHVLALARQAEAIGPDAKAEALLDLFRALRQEEGDPELKFLIFTEFTATQDMLAEFLQDRGFSVACLNGSLGLEERRLAQQDFAGPVQVLVSTEAGGEGLNLQFCHLVFNYDLPWNPMRLEQRIGRVDRIGQKQGVRAFNLTLAETVEHRVREVLEQKLAVIYKEFGADKASDVLESVDEGAGFEALGTEVIEGAERALQRVEALALQFRLRLAGAREAEDTLPSTQALDASLARDLEHHPLGLWLERMVPAAVRASGGTATVQAERWNLHLPGQAPVTGTFSRPVAERHGEGLLSLETDLVQRLLQQTPGFEPGRPACRLRLFDLPAEVSGAWSLWRVGLEGAEPRQVRILPVFLDEHGRSFRASARLVWDRLLQSDLLVAGSVPWPQVEPVLQRSQQVAKEHGLDLFLQLQARQEAARNREREKRLVALEARRRALARLGLETVRRHRERLLREDEARLAASSDRDFRDLPVLEPLVLVFLEPGTEASP